MKEERREIEETMRNAKPKEVGDVRRRIMGATEAAERMKRVKFKQESRRFGKESELLRLLALEEAIFGELILFELILDDN